MGTGYSVSSHHGNMPMEIYAKSDKYCLKFKLETHKTIFEGYLVIYTSSHLLTSHNICNREFKSWSLVISPSYSTSLVIGDSGYVCELGDT